VKFEYDVIVVGSGPSGISATYPLLQKGLRVLLVDGGQKPSLPPPAGEFLNIRARDHQQWKWMVGEDFYALRMKGATSPKLRVPSLGFAFKDFASSNRIIPESFVVVGSLATGGLSTAWGCGVACLSRTELADFPCSSEDMLLSYERVAKRIGISGRCKDDMSDYFGLDEWAQSPIKMDQLNQYLHDRYAKKRPFKRFRLGRARVAALSVDLNERKACNLSGNCLWGCSRQSLYSAADEMVGLRRHRNFADHSGFIADRITCKDGSCEIFGQDVKQGQTVSFTARKIVLAAGTLATTRIVLHSLGITRPLSMLSCPTAAFILWLPYFLGRWRTPSFGLGQLSFVLEDRSGVSAFGSTFSVGGIPVTEFARYMPFRRRYGIEVLRSLLNSCLVGNLFLPGKMSRAQVRLSENGELLVSGQHSEMVSDVMARISTDLRKIFWQLGAILLPGSFTAGLPGSDIHYAGTLPMRLQPTLGETDLFGEVLGLEGVHVVDAACIPVLSEKSHTLTIMANADRIARSLQL
jgi:choline dehydrogenase-like flavoprotein